MAGLITWPMTGQTKRGPSTSWRKEETSRVRERRGAGWGAHQLRDPTWPWASGPPTSSGEASGSFLSSWPPAHNCLHPHSPLPTCPALLTVDFMA